MLKRLDLRAIPQGLALVLALMMALAQVSAAPAQDSAPAEPVAESAAETAVAALPTIAGMRILNNEERARLIIDLDATSEFAIAALSGPDRLVVDLKAGQLAEPIAETPAGDGLLSAYALDTAEEGRVRAVLTLAAPVQVQQAYQVEPVDNQPARLIVDLIPDTPARFAQRVNDDFRAALARQQAEEDAALASAEPAPVTQVPETPLVIATGQPRPLIVIDPGHGGIDGGATADNGARGKGHRVQFRRGIAASAGRHEPV